MAVSTTTAPELTAEQVQRILVQPLEAVSTFLAAGLRIIDTAGPLRLPEDGSRDLPRLVRGERADHSRGRRRPSTRSRSCPRR